MGIFEQVQTRKAISAYGGVGSLLETRDGSILISPFDEWPFFQAVNGKFEDHNTINDKRFKNRLSKYFQQLELLVRIPTNDLRQGFKTDNNFAYLSAKYFPEWFYCSNCKRFERIDSWKHHWETSVDLKDKENFFPPKCYHCYLKNKGKKKRFYDLEQVRFVLTSPNGEIADIPWDKWALLRNKKKSTNDNETKNTEDEIINFSNIIVPDDLILEYKTSDKLDDLTGIWIIAKNKKGEQLNFTTLSGLFNLRLKIQDVLPNSAEKDIIFKPVIRSSNSVYYPNILSSIFIPANDEINDFVIGLIKEECEDGGNATQISKNLKRYKKIEIDVNTIQNLIDSNFSEREAEISKTENQYRFDEYKFITEKGCCDRKNDLIFNKISDSYFQNNVIKSIYKMDKIKITSVQTSYTRQEPILMDSFLTDVESQNLDSIRKKFTSAYGKNTSFLPATESFGEGIFFDFDDSVLNEWISKYPDIEKRISIIVENYNNLESSIFDDIQLTPKYILIHTFSHLIIKELEYLCGYPATSLQERLYIDDELKMNGVLIYTIAGSEGSYGGLTSLCDSDKIGKLIQSAMIRAKDCATDPICYHTNGQGVSNLNLSACFSCILLPETSCEMFNCFLDRRILIDKEYGYFKE